MNESESKNVHLTRDYDADETKSHNKVCDGLRKNE